MIDRCEGDTANMVRVAWMKNCGGKRERERERRGPLGGEREWGVEEVGWGEREGNKSVSGVLAAQ